MAYSPTINEARGPRLSEALPATASCGVRGHDADDSRGIVQATGKHPFHGVGQ